VLRHLWGLAFRRTGFKVLGQMAILDSGRLSSSTLIRQTFANLWNIINDTDNVPLPSGLPSNHKYVYRRLPKTLGRGFNGYPFIVVSRSMPKKRPGTASLTKSFMDFEFSIRVFTRDKDSDSLGNPNGADQCDEITDAITTTLNDVDNRKSLLFNGMGNLEFDIDSDEDEIDDKTVFVSEFDIRFNNNLTATG